MKRICIYLTFDSQKIVDRYIGYMLKELKTCVDYLAVVCNEDNVVQGKNVLEQYANVIFYRENIGLDAGGFKDALTKFIGWKKILEYDELVLVNDSLFGPFSSMKNIFYIMEKVPVDFWGLSKHGEYRKKELDTYPEHIQSFFITIRSKMLHSNLFKSYWEEMPYYSSYHQVVRKHEMLFTQHFFKLGFTYDVLADIEVNNSLKPENNYCQYVVIPYELVKKRNFPFLKRQQIAEDNKLEKQTQEELFQVMQYIDKETYYDVNLIWENIIRTLNISDLQRNLHFRYIISEGSEYGEHKENIAIIVFVSYRSSAETVIDYLRNLKKINLKINIIAQSKELLDDYKNNEWECAIVAKENIAEFLSNYGNYDLVCILNDADLTSEIRPNYIGKSYFFNSWNNLAKDEMHVTKIQKLFDENPYLGLLTNPQPNFGEYFGEFGKGWDGKFEEVINLVKDKGINCQISMDKPPFRKPKNLWIRGKILAKLKGWTGKEVLYLPYLWIYIVQHCGYYSGIVESSEYAAMNEINLQYYLEKITEKVRYQYGSFENFLEFEKKISEANLNEFCTKYNRILVYGTGIIARKYKDILPRPEMYIVSDGQARLKELDGVPVKYLSEIENIDDFGIILCLNRKNQVQVIKELNRRGIKNYLCI